MHKITKHHERRSIKDLTDFPSWEPIRRLSEHARGLTAYERHQAQRLNARILVTLRWAKAVLNSLPDQPDPVDIVRLHSLIREYERDEES